MKDGSSYRITFYRGSTIAKKNEAAGLEKDTLAWQYSAQKVMDLMQKLQVPNKANELVPLLSLKKPVILNLTKGTGFRDIALKQPLSHLSLRSDRSENTSTSTLPQTTIQTTGKEIEDIRTKTVHLPAVFPTLEHNSDMNHATLKLFFANPDYRKLLEKELQEEKTHPNDPTRLKNRKKLQKHLKKLLNKIQQIPIDDKELKKLLNKIQTKVNQLSDANNTSNEQTFISRLLELLEANTNTSKVAVQEESVITYTNTSKKPLEETPKYHSIITLDLPQQQQQLTIKTLLKNHLQKKTLENQQQQLYLHNSQQPNSLLLQLNISNMNEEKANPELTIEENLTVPFQEITIDDDVFWDPDSPNQQTQYTLKSLVLYKKEAIKSEQYVVLIKNDQGKWELHNNEEIKSFDNLKQALNELKNFTPYLLNYQKAPQVPSTQN